MDRVRPNEKVFSKISTRLAFYKTEVSQSNLYIRDGKNDYRLALLVFFSLRFAPGSAVSGVGLSVMFCSSLGT